VLLMAAPYFVYPVFLIKMLCFCLFACAFNLLSHTTGLLTFGHAAFFGFSAYTAGHAAKVWGLPTEAALLIGTTTGAAPAGRPAFEVSLRQPASLPGRVSQ
jgi:branched-chain amino acid transport system permease protein